MYLLTRSRFWAAFLVSVGVLAAQQRGPETLTIPPNGAISAFTPFTTQLSAADSFFTGAYPKTGTRHDFSSRVTWMSNSPDATVSPTGLLTAAGTSCLNGCPLTITATFGRFHATIPVTVYSPKTLTISNVSSTITNPLPSGEFQQFDAMAAYKDPLSTSLDVTTLAQWNSSNTAAIAVDSFAFPSHGLAQAAGTSGSSNISSSLLGINSNILSLTAAAPVITSLVTVPTNNKLAVGSNSSVLSGLCGGNTVAAYTACGHYSDGSAHPLPFGTDTVTWSSSDNTVATVNSATGLVNGVKAGVVQVIATPNSAVCSNAASDCSSGLNVGLTGILALASPTSVFKGGAQQLDVMATFSDAVTRDVTNSLSWTTSAVTNVKVNKTGKVTAVGLAGSSALISGFVGSSAVNCVSPFTFCAQTTVNVTPAQVKAITVTPPSATVPLGATQQFTATATNTDNSTSDVTFRSIWASSAPAVAGISNTTAANYAAAAVGANWTTPGNATGPKDTNYAVYDNTLQDYLKLTDFGLNVPAGVTITGVMVYVIGNGSSANMADREIDVGITTDGSTLAGSLKTAQVLNQGADTNLFLGAETDLWGNAGLTVAQVTSPNFGVLIRDSDTVAAPININAVVEQVFWTVAGASNGLATALTQPGSSNITATGPLQTVTSLPVPLTTAPAALLAVNVTPKKPTLPSGSNKQFTAKGTYTDGSVFTLPFAGDANHAPAPVSWSSSTINAASIDAVSGLATAIAYSATTTIQATSGGVSGSTLLTVVPATLKSIAVTPANPSLPVDATQQFVATGTLTDGSTQDLTATATWNSSKTQFATISNADGSEGLATGVAVGSTVITATDPTTGKFSNVTLTVTARALQSIAVTAACGSPPCPSSATVIAGGTQQYVATGTYDAPPTTQDITDQATWSSSDPSVATINASGLATARGPVTATITAAQGAIMGAGSITVDPATLTSITVLPTGAIPSLGSTQQYTATGNYSDGSTLDLTNLAAWSTGSPNVATIDASGLLTTVDPGPTTVTATCDTTCPGVSSGNVSATVPVTVSF